MQLPSWTWLRWAATEVPCWVCGPGEACWHSRWRWHTRATMGAAPIPARPPVARARIDTIVSTVGRTRTQMRPRRQICVRTVCACACAHARHRCRRAWPRASGSMRDTGARVRGRVRQSMRGPCTCTRLFGGVYGGMAPAVKVALLESAFLLRRHWIRPLWARLDHMPNRCSEIRGHACEFLI